MCKACWEYNGSPKIFNENVMIAAACIERVYGHSDVGGNLHIVLDDWNIKDGHLDMCEKHINEARSLGKWGEIPYDDRWYHAEVSCLREMLHLSEAERCSALAINDNLWRPCEAPA